MMTRYGYLAACLLFVTSLASAADTNPVAVALRALQKQFPALTPHAPTATTGDLNNDRLSDVAVLVSEGAGAEQDSRILKVAVMLGVAGGGFRHFATSSDVYAHERASIFVEIKRRSLFLQRSGSGGCCSDWAERMALSFPSSCAAISMNNSSCGDSE